MAATATHRDDELETHRKTWNNFVRLITYATIGIAVVLIWMAVFLTP